MRKETEATEKIPRTEKVNLMRGTLIRGIGSFYTVKDEKRSEYVLRCKKKFRHEKMVPMGCSPPRNVAAMPLKPIPGTEDWVTDHCSYPVR